MILGDFESGISIPKNRWQCELYKCLKAHDSMCPFASLMEAGKLACEFPLVGIVGKWNDQITVDATQEHAFVEEK